MMFHKKGQGLSVNAIIVALLALIVLVVLVVMFVTRTTDVDIKSQKAADTILIPLRITYGSCRPTDLDEISFKKEYVSGDVTAANGDETAHVQAKTKFEQRIDVCKAVADKSACEAGACKWKS